MSAFFFFPFFFQVVSVFTYRELLGCDACVHHSFVHALECIKIWRCNEHHVRHELCCFQNLQSLERKKVALAKHTWRHR